VKIDAFCDALLRRWGWRSPSLNDAHRILRAMPNRQLCSWVPNAPKPEHATWSAPSGFASDACSIHVPACFLACFLSVALPTCSGTFPPVYWPTMTRRGVTWLRRGLRNLWCMPRCGLPR